MPAAGGTGDAGQRLLGAEPEGNFQYRVGGAGPAECRNCRDGGWCGSGRERAAGELRRIRPVAADRRHVAVRLHGAGNGSNGPPDGTPIDAGFQTWHEDGTELMNSGRPPATGSFCEGVWEQQNWSSFSLNHWALSWDFDPATGKPTVFVGPTNIQEQVKVDVTGNSFTGTFSLTQYAPDGTTVMGGVKGVVNATRVTVN
jgi:hypothetical protein